MAHALLARNLSDADLCAAIGKMQGRAASAVAREVRGDRDAYSVALERKPIKAHNAAFEDSWFMLHLPGYAEARRAGKIIVIDSRHICRSIDEEVRTLPRESAPASLENWARRRGTLSADEAERHLGLDDTDLMLRTVQAEFNGKNMFKE